MGLKGTPGKIDDDWGAWIRHHKVEVGEKIEISTKSGKKWSDEVAEIVWQGEKNGEDLTLVRLVGDGKPKPAAKSCKCECSACQACEHKQVGGGTESEDSVPF